MAHNFNPSTQWAEAGTSMWVYSLRGLCREFQNSQWGLSQKILPLLWWNARWVAFPKFCAYLGIPCLWVIQITVSFGSALWICSDFCLLSFFFLPLYPLPSTSPDMGLFCLCPSCTHFLSFSLTLLLFISQPLLLIPSHSLSPSLAVSWCVCLSLGFCFCLWRYKIKNGLLDSLLGF